MERARDLVDGPGALGTGDQLALVAWTDLRILMTVLAFWTAGQFFIEKAYVLLVFAGIWTLMESITDIMRAPLSCSPRIESCRSRAMVVPS